MSIECSVVVPLFNQELHLPTLHLRLLATLRRLTLPHEIIYVDDGSTDRTAGIIRELHESDSAVKAVFLSRRFGLQSAQCAGLDAACGRVVITLNGDLQDPPELIADMLDKWSEGYQLIYARLRKPQVGLCKRAVCFAFSRVLRKLTKLPMLVDTGDYVLMDRTVVEQLTAMPERTRSIHGLRNWVGFRQIDVLYDRERREGHSKLSVFGMAHRAFDGIFAFSEAPLKAVMLLGMLICATWAVAVGLKMAAVLAAAWTPLMMLGLAGMQMLGMGMLGEYIARIHREVRGRPLYIARERLGFRATPRPVRNVLQFLPSREAERQEQLTAARLSSDGPEILFTRDSW